jgi:hypothetical protein
MVEQNQGLKIECKIRRYYSCLLWCYMRAAAAAEAAAAVAAEAAAAAAAEITS